MTAATITRSHAKQALFPTSEKCAKHKKVVAALRAIENDDTALDDGDSDFVWFKPDWDDLIYN